MKYLLVLICKNNEETEGLLTHLEKEGYNATVLVARSLKHFLESDEEEFEMFFSLRHITEHHLKDSTFAYFILDEDKIDHAKEIIRKETNNFKEIKGCMYSHTLSDYEGTI